jgi:uncharacterized protein DUF547
MPKDWHGEGLEFQRLSKPAINRLRKDQEKRKKNGMWLSKSARGLGISGRGAIRRVAAGSLLMGLLGVGCSSVPTTFHPHDPLAPSQVSYHDLHEVLQASVKDGHVNYLAITGDNRFGAYLSQLDRVDPVSLSTRDEQLAFWINAYNAFAIQSILDGESPALYVGWYRYFKLRKYGIGGAQLNLFDVQHVILRQQFHEPRVHFAIVCASVSCPKLQSWAFEGRQLTQQLDQVAREFVNDTSRNRFDRQGKIAFLSKIFDWFEEDFVASAGSVQKFVARYVRDPDVARNLAADTYHLKYLEYDWGMRGTPPRNTDQARAS